VYQAIIFDLGETLVSYEGVPLDWSGNYHAAISEAMNGLGVSASSNQYEMACSVLSSYNTRINPREFEVAGVGSALLDRIGSMDFG
jgi:putative hydrolase of the HAD superfamily